MSGSASQRPSNPVNKLFTGLSEFVADAPLYAKFECADEAALPLFQNPGVVDSFCPACDDRSTFQRDHTPRSVSSIAHLSDGYYTSAWTCARDRSHIIRIFIHKQNNTIWKVGQEPSLADIAINASKEFRSVLKGDNKAELTRAIGLSTHGIGIGSFVYLRRIFERLIAARQAASNISLEEFSGKRMGEKIDLLKDHLPQFLVQNKSIYGILSKGIHELSEEDCLTYYPVMYESIVLILQQDKQRAEEADRLKRLTASIHIIKTKSGEA